MFKFPASSLMRAVFWLALALCVISTTTEATLMRYLEVEDLARLSREVVRGQVLSTKTYWDDSHKHILTGVRLRVSDCYKGQSKQGGIVTLIQLGGTLDGITMDYSGRPTFRVGEDLVVFTRPNERNELLVVGLKQGKLAVRGEEAVRELNGVTFIDADLTASAQRPASRKLVQTRYALNELRDRVARVR